MAVRSEEIFLKRFDQAGASLQERPAWRELLTYRGVSVWEAGHWALYYSLLDTLRQPAAWSPQVPGVPGRWRARLRRLATGANDAAVGPQDLAGVLLRRLADRGRLLWPASRVPAGSRERRVLFLEAYASNLSTVLPVAQVLQRDLGWDVLLASWEQGLLGRVRRAGIPYLGFHQVWRRRLLGLEARHRRGVSLLLRGLDPRDALAGLEGVNVATAFRPGGPVEDVCVRVRLLADASFDLLERYRPHVVVMANEHTTEGRTMALVAALGGVPTVAIQHGLYAECPAYHRLSTGRILVWGSPSREFWLARGCLPQQIVETGAVRYDAPRLALDGAGPPPAPHREGPTVLVAWQGWGSEFSRAQHAASLAALLQAAARLPEARFIFKAHPGERRRFDLYRRAIAGAGVRNVRLATHGSIGPLIEACDLMITFFSTAGLEAMIAGRPVLALHLAEGPPLAGYASAGATALVTREEELAPVIQKMLTDPQARQALVEAGRRFAQEYLGPLDGSAAHRAAGAIAEMASPGAGTGPSQSQQDPASLRSHA